MTNSARSPKQLGERIRYERQALDRSQTELGDGASVTQKTISRLENGDGAIRLATLFDVLTALNLEIVIKPRTDQDSADIEDIF